MNKSPSPYQNITTLSHCLIDIGRDTYVSKHLIVHLTRAARQMASYLAKQAMSLQRHTALTGGLGWVTSDHIAVHPHTATSSMVHHPEVFLPPPLSIKKVGGAIRPIFSFSISVCRAKPQQDFLPLTGPATRRKLKLMRSVMIGIFWLYAYTVIR